MSRVKVCVFGTIKRLIVTTTARWPLGDGVHYQNHAIILYFCIVFFFIFFLLILTQPTLLRLSVGRIEFCSGKIASTCHLNAYSFVYVSIKSTLSWAPSLLLSSSPLLLLLLLTSLSLYHRTFHPPKPIRNVQGSISMNRNGKTKTSASWVCTYICNMYVNKVNNSVKSCYYYVHTFHTQKNKQTKRENENEGSQESLQVHRLFVCSLSLLKCRIFKMLLKIMKHLKFMHRASPQIMPS